MFQKGFEFSRSNAEIREMLIESEESYNAFYDAVNDDETREKYPELFSAVGVKFNGVNFPDRVYYIIFSFLPVDEVFSSVVIACSKFHKIIENTMFYKSVVENTLRKCKKQKRTQEFLAQNGGSWKKLLIAQFSPWELEITEEKELLLCVYNATPLDLTRRLKNANGKLRYNTIDTVSIFSYAKDIRLEGTILHAKVKKEDGYFDSKLDLCRFVRVKVADCNTIEDDVDDEKYLVVISWKWN